MNFHYCWYLEQDDEAAALYIILQVSRRRREYYVLPTPSNGTPPARFDMFDAALTGVKAPRTRHRTVIEVSQLAARLLGISIALRRARYFPTAMSYYAAYRRAPDYHARRYAARFRMM